MKAILVFFFTHKKLKTNTIRSYLIGDCDFLSSEDNMNYMPEDSDFLSSEDNMNYMPEDSYHSPGHASYGEPNPYGGMNGGPGSVHSSRVSLHSNSSNRPRQVMLCVRKEIVRPVFMHPPQSGEEHIVLP